MILRLICPKPMRIDSLSILLTQLMVTIRNHTLVNLCNTTNGSEIQTKDIFRSGASGSPMLNSKYTTMYGMRTYGHNLGGTATDMYAKQESSGGESFKGYAGKFVRQHIK